MPDSAGGQAGNLAMDVVDVHVTPDQLEALYLVPALTPGHQYEHFLREGLRIITTGTGPPAARKREPPRSLPDAADQPRDERCQHQRSRSA
jgi:hypothetical protein